MCPGIIYIQEKVTERVDSGEGETYENNMEYTPRRRIDMHTVTCKRIVKRSLEFTLNDASVVADSRTSETVGIS